MIGLGRLEAMPSLSFSPKCQNVVTLFSKIFPFFCPPPPRFMFKICPEDGAEGMVRGVYPLENGLGVLHA